MARVNGNLVAAAAASLPRDNNRTYLYFQVTSGSLTIAIDGSASVITLSVTGNGETTWEPRVCPQNAITVTGTGIMITG